MTNLFNWGNFTLHTEEESSFFIDCDALTDDDIITVARLLRAILPLYRDVVGIPQGGLRLAQELRQYRSERKIDPILLVDDVLTTGTSMKQYKSFIKDPVIGAVIFDRSDVTIPYWITALFTMAKPK